MHLNRIVLDEIDGHLLKLEKGKQYERSNRKAKSPRNNEFLGLSKFGGPSQI
ncbi:protein of unknown function [Vibrio tapetis subsp. tapetis]|uniref:Uncharacterized protein n=1 Tax=Vibrio tapetis subsp. tapetis TaxID=1671868 RepID=A0A2N8Z8D1_9VIBR|nr:protein of unknown function [Vibrio tapetis subsp. tapetis]